MKHLIYIVMILSSIQIFGQKHCECDSDRVQIDLLTIERNNNDIVPSSIIEVYSGGKRIKAGISDFDGVSILFINSDKIVNNLIRLKILAPKCKPFEKEFDLMDKLNETIYLEYGKTEYTHRKQLSEMLEKMNIDLRPY